MAFGHLRRIWQAAGAGPALGTEITYGAHASRWRSRRAPPLFSSGPGAGGNSRLKGDR